MSYRKSLNWKENDGDYYTVIPGMANIELRTFDDNMQSVIINGIDAVIQGTVNDAIAWAEGYVAGRFQDIKVTVKLK